MSSVTPDGFEDDDIEDLWFSIDNDENDEDDEDDQDLLTPWWNEKIKKQPKPSVVIPSHDTTTQQLEQKPPSPKVKRKHLPGRWIKDGPYWDLRLKLLQKYHKEHGHIVVPYMYESPLTRQELQIDAPYRIKSQKKKKRLRLGKVVFGLRRYYQEETLQEKVPSDVIEKLNQLGMVWTSIGKGRRPAQFQKNVDNWKRYSKDNHTMSDSLRTWMWSQRYMHGRQQRGQDGTLTPERIQALTDAGILPFVRPKNLMQQHFDSQWNTMLLKWKQQQQRALDPDVEVWAWEQHRMSRVLRGETVGSCLPMLLKEPRLQTLTEAGFFKVTDTSVYPNVAPEQDIVTMDMNWDTVWSSLQEYYTRQSHCSITPNQNATLYSMQRRLLYEYRRVRKGAKMDKSLLNEDRIKQLQAIGALDDTAPDTAMVAEFLWWENYHDLRRYRNLLGTVQVLKEDDSELHEWLQLQMDLCRSGSMDNDLSETHVVALSKVGVAFEHDKNPEPPAFRTAQDVAVGRRPAILELNHLLVNSTYSGLSTNGKRKESVQGLTWMARYEEMRRLIDQHGNSQVLSGQDGLALWAYNQRVQYSRYLQGKKTSLTPRRIEMLKDIGFELDEDSSLLDSHEEEDEWNSMLSVLSRYSKEHGHCFIPVNHPSFPSLGQWVHKQRQLYQQQTRKHVKIKASDESLTAERIRLLTEAGLDLDMDNVEYSRKAFQTLWDARVAELLQFKLEHGHCNVEAEPLYLNNKYQQLGKWVGEQRRFYKLWKEQRIPSHLNQDRIDQLNSLGFEWQEDGMESASSY